MVRSGHGEGVFVMSSEIIAQVPEAYGTGIMPFQGPSLRAVARSTRREVDAVLGRVRRLMPGIRRGRCWPRGR